MRHAETFSNEDRNPSGSGGIRHGVGGTTGQSEGQVVPPQPRLGSDRDTTTPRRVSEPGPPTSRPGRPTPLGPVRVCRNPKCRRRAPLAEFPLHDDPVAKARGYATRLWCDHCLVTGGHLTPKQVAQIKRRWRREAAEAEAKRAAERERQEARRLLSEHRASLVRRAAEDPLFARALLDAAESKRVAEAANR